MRILVLMRVALFLAVSGLLVAGCDSVSPTAPIGGSITLEATPSTVAETGGVVTLLALVRNDLGQPLAGTQVNFSTEIGALDSGGGLVQTDGSGRARDNVVGTEGELRAFTGETFQVTVETAKIDGQLISATDTIRILRLPRANFDFSVNGRTVVFEDTSTGSPTSWGWRFGDPQGDTSQLQNPTKTYEADDTYTVTLTVTNSLGEDTISKNVAVELN